MCTMNQECECIMIHANSVSWYFWSNPVWNLCPTWITYNLCGIIHSFQFYDFFLPENHTHYYSIHRMFFSPFFLAISLPFSPSENRIFIQTGSIIVRFLPSKFFLSFFLHFFLYFFSLNFYLFFPSIFLQFFLFVLYWCTDTIVLSKMTVIIRILLFMTRNTTRIKIFPFLSIFHPFFLSLFFPQFLSIPYSFFDPFFLHPDMSTYSEILGIETNGNLHLFLLQK